MVKETYVFKCECGQVNTGNLARVFPMWIACLCGKKYGIHIVPDGSFYKVVTTPESDIQTKKEVLEDGGE